MQYFSGSMNSWMMGHITGSCSLQRHHSPPLSDQVDGRDPTGWPANPIWATGRLKTKPCSIFITKAPSCIAILSTLGICILFVWWMGLCSLEYRHYRYILFSFLGQSQGRYASTHFTACTLSVCLWPIARVEYRLMMFLRFMAHQYSNIPPTSHPAHVLKTQINISIV